MQAIINGEMYEVEPAVKVIIDKMMIENAELKKENARLEEGYQKSLGVIAATDCVKCKDKAYINNDENAEKMKQVSKNEFHAYISKYDYYVEDNDELRVKNAPYNEYLDIKQNRTDRLLGRISEFLLNHKLKCVYEIQEDKNNG